MLDPANDPRLQDRALHYLIEEENRMYAADPAREPVSRRKGLTIEIGEVLMALLVGVGRGGYRLLCRVLRRGG